MFHERQRRRVFVIVFYLDTITQDTMFFDLFFVFSFSSFTHARALFPMASVSCLASQTTRSEASGRHMPFS